MRKKTMRWLQVVAALLVLAVIAVAAFLTGVSSTSGTADGGPDLTATVDTPGEGSAYQAVLDVVPDAPAEVMTAPPTAEWWKVIAALSPDAGLADVYPGDAGVDLVGFAYSLNATQGDNAKDVAPLFPALYVQTTSVEDAETVMAWLDQQTGADVRRAWRDGTVVLIVPAWVDQNAEFTLDTKSATDALADRVGTPDSRAVWTLSLGRYNSLLASAAADDETATAARRLGVALGLGDKARFTVTAAHPGDTWLGAARGVNPGAIDLAAANTLILGSGRIITQGSLDDGSRVYVRATGMQDILRNSTFTAWVDGAPASTIGVPDGAGATLRADNTTTAMTGRITFATWASALRGVDGVKAGATSVEFALASDGAVALRPFQGVPESVVPGPTTGKAPAVGGGPEGAPPAPAAQPGN